MNDPGTQSDAPGAMIGKLLRAARALEGRMEDALSEVGLTCARYGVLEQLARAGEPRPLGDLAARVSCVRSNMTQLVDRLEAEGLVRRVADPADRRCVRAELTPLGVERERQGAAQLRRVKEAFADSLPEADRAALARALDGIG